MDVRKGILVAVLVIGACFASASLGVVPLPEAIQDGVVAVVGVVGLGLASVFRALGTVAIPVLTVLRVLSVPIAIGVLAWLILRELRRSRG